MEDIEKPKILIEDDRPENLLTLEIIFEKEAYDIVKALSGNEALSLVLANEFAVILLDVQMPGMDGFETAELIRSNKKTEHMPIIFVTAINKEKKYIFKGYDSGAVDYLFKPLNENILKNKVKVFIELYRQKRAIEIKNIQLEAANKKILKQQNALMEEERLKVLLQMAGATAHELNQPLMSLLCNIELIQKINNPEKLSKCLSAIEKSGNRIAGIVKRIQFIRHEHCKVYQGSEKIIDIRQNLNIFWLEDEDSCFIEFSKMLGKKLICDVTRAVTIKEAGILLSENNYDVAFFEFKLPDGESLKLLNFMREEKIKIPVIVLTGFGDEVIATRCIEAGAHGYLSKENITPDILHQGIERAFEKFHLETDMNKAMKKIADMATKDELTGLYNRRYMQDVFERELKYSRRYDTDLSCMILDLDYFKKVNDSYGHNCGDIILKKFSEILKQVTRDLDYVFRYGGEEFLILFTRTGVEGVTVAAEKIRMACESEEYSYNEHKIHVTVSIGTVSVNQLFQVQVTDIIGFADKALYQAKKDGRNCVRAYIEQSVYPKELKI